MISVRNEILYIGKAKNLTKRVRSYANPMKFNYRLQKMVSLVNKVDFIITKNEAYALLLEASLIKEIKPKFNILLKDDKNLEKVENINIARAYMPYARERMSWSRIS